jgi:DNA-binding response OmpR family regulator
VAARVLVVDDEPMVLDALREILAAAGYVTLGATSFEDGGGSSSLRPPRTSS